MATLPRKMFLTDQMRERYMEVVSTMVSDEVITEQLTSWQRKALEELHESLRTAPIDGPDQIRPPAPAPDPQRVDRQELLARAGDIIGGDRQQTYGDAESSFQRIADLWHGLLGVPVSATDVARMMILMKVSRLQWHPEHADSWVDIAGYAALGAEIAGVEL